MIKLVSDLTHGQLDCNGKILLDRSIETSILLSLFGGNFEGSTTANRKPAGIENPDYFGNLYFQEVKKPLFNSKFEKFLKENPLSSGNLITLNQYALEDLEWIIKNKAVKKFKISLEIVSANELKIDITADQPDKTEKKYTYLWSR